MACSPGAEWLWGRDGDHRGSILCTCARARWLLNVARGGWELGARRRLAFPCGWSRSGSTASHCALLLVTPADSRQKPGALSLRVVDRRHLPSLPLRASGDGMRASARTHALHGWRWLAGAELQDHVEGLRAGWRFLPVPQSRRRLSLLQRLLSAMLRRS